MRSSIAIVLLCGLTTGAQAQSTTSLGDFDLIPNASATPDPAGTAQTTANQSAQPAAPASEMEACLLDQSNCANSEYKSNTALSLDDVVNLGIVKHDEIRPKPDQTKAVTANNVATAPVSSSVSSSEPLPTIDIEILFDSGSKDVRQDQENKLRELAGVLNSKQFDGYRFLFLGHTDAKGAEAFNWALSQSRAESVATVIRIYTGLPADRILSSGLGETRLKEPNFPLSGINRRVQLVLLR